MKLALYVQWDRTVKVPSMGQKCWMLVVSVVVTTQLVASQLCTYVGVARIARVEPECCLRVSLQGQLEFRELTK